MPFKANVALQLLARAKGKERLGHAYLISGPKEADLPGFAVKTLNLVSGECWPDLESWEKHGALVLRPESKSRQIRIETIREQVEPFLYVTTSGAAHRFCVFVDAERMNQATQNAFLRTLEEPPPRTLFLLLSTQPEQFLETTLSRVIRIALLPETNIRQLSVPEAKLVRLLTDLANRPTDSLAGALALRKEFDDILTEIEDRLTKELESGFEEEKKFYKQTTDVDNAWLKDREEETKASIEARYRQERDGLMELLLTWLGDVLRHQVGVSRLDLPEHAAATGVLAQRWDPATVSRRIKELRRLHSNLHTNVQENLALDAAFVAAFA